MTQISDTFARANGALGANWAAVIPNHAEFLGWGGIPAGNILINSNGVGPDATNGLDCACLWNGGQTFGNNQWAVAAIKTIAGPTATLNITAAAGNSPSPGLITFTYTVATGSVAAAISGGALNVLVSGFVNAANNGAYVATTFGAGTFTVVKGGGVNEAAAATGFCPSDSGVGVGVRMSGTSPGTLNGYFFHVGSNSFGGGGRKFYYELWKCVNGVGGDLMHCDDSVLSDTSPVAGDTIAITVIGNVVTAYYNGQILTGGALGTGVYQVTDNSITGGGGPGLWTFAVSGASEYVYSTWTSGSVQFGGNNGTTVNNFQAGDISTNLFTPLATENFTESGTFGNSDLVPYTNGDLHTKNANWVYQGASSFTVSSNKVYSNVAGISFAYRSDISAPTNDQWAEEVVSLTTVTGTQNSGPAVRVSTSAQTAYILQMGTNLLRLSSVIAGVTATLGDALSPAVTGDAVRITVVGTTLKVFKNGVLVIGPITDANIASGNVGIFSAGNATVNGFSKWAGGSMTELTAATNFVDDVNQFVLLDPTNGCFVGIADSTGFAQILENTVTWPNDQYCEMEINDISDLTIIRGPGVRTAPGSQGYFIVNTSISTVRLYRLVTGQPGVIIGTASHTWVAGDLLRVEAQGVYIVGKVNGVKVIEAIDLALTSGKPGAVWASGVASKGGSGIGAIATLTSFAAGQILAPPPGGSGGSTDLGGGFDFSF
jgi:hypothetical protein